MVDGIFGHPARVARIAPEMYTALSERINDENPFIWPAIISNDRMDSYYTRMHETSLRNYAEDLNAGIAFQNSHRHNELPLGRSLSGEFDAVNREVTGYFYTVAGLNLNGVNTNDFIRGIETGIIADVSIGFHGGDYRCSVCDRDLFDAECTHVPGLRYDENLAFAWVRNSRLAETSAVYEGATPGATVLKAERAADAGWLRPEAAQIIEQRYRIKLPGARHAWSGAQTTKEDVVEGIRELIAKIVPAAADLDELEGVRALADQLATTTGERDSARQELEALRAQVAGLEPLRAKVAELEPLALDGKAYRADLVTEALAEGVRAHGDGFAKETYEGLLASAPIAVVKRMRDDWRAVADKIFVGGRASEDKGAEQKAAAAPKITVPSKAYKG